MYECYKSISVGYWYRVFSITAGVVVVARIWHSPSLISAVLINRWPLTHCSIYTMMFSFANYLTQAALCLAHQGRFVAFLSLAKKRRFNKQGMLATWNACLLYTNPFPTHTHTHTDYASLLYSYPHTDFAKTLVTPPHPHQSILNVFEVSSSTYYVRIHVHSHTIKFVTLILYTCTCTTVMIYYVMLYIGNEFDVEGWTTRACSHFSPGMCHTISYQNSC